MFIRSFPFGLSGMLMVKDFNSKSTALFQQLKAPVPIKCTYSSMREGIQEKRYKIGGDS